MTFMHSAQLLLVRDDEVVAMVLGTITQSDRPRVEAIEGSALAIELLDIDTHYTFLIFPSWELIADHAWAVSLSPCTIFENGAHYYEKVNFQFSLLTNHRRANEF